jgi:polygalacturonase
MLQPLTSRISEVLEPFSKTDFFVNKYNIFSGIVDDDSTDTVWKNGALLNATLGSMQPYDTLIFPDETFYLMGGIMAEGLSSVTFVFDGTVVFSNDTETWPTNENDDVLECIYMKNITNVTFTSSNKDKKGTLDGNGRKWWGFPGLGYLRREENRPRLFNIESSSNILVENLLFLDSPYWTFWVHDVDGLEVRFSEISARRTDADYHDIIDITAFNTDGFDVTGVCMMCV